MHTLCPSEIALPPGSLETPSTAAEDLSACRMRSTSTLTFASRRFPGICMQVSLQTRDRDPPPGTDLESRRELAGAAQPIEGVSMQANSAGGFRYRNQIVCEP